VGSVHFVSIPRVRAEFGQSVGLVEVGDSRSE
jgi:hypothetical protein